MVKQNKAAAECISDDALQHFKTYKYSSVDKSPISNHILRHYWNACVEFLPLWLAPNMVTLLGFFFVIGNVGLMELMDPDLEGPKQSWVYYSYAFGVWAYSTMDNIDGKQARRTGTSSGLGELFDHGIDSLNCTLASLLETSAMALGATKIGALTALIPTLPMFFSTWETYHTHTLFLGYFNGPTEGLMIASAIMLASGFYGPQIWHKPMSDVVGFEEQLGSWSVKDVWAVLLLVAFFVGHLPSCVYNVVDARRAKGLPIAPVFLEWIPMVVFSGALVAWLGSPYSALLADNHLCLLCLTLSFVFGRMTTKTILAHLTRQPYPYWTVLIVPLIGGAVLVNLPYLGLPAVSARSEHLYLWGYFILSMIVYFRWAFLVINAICDYLGIQCLTIPEDKWRSLQRQQQSSAASEQTARERSLSSQEKGKSA
ncbi:sn-1,2-diacylglycerol cholinephosphotransferase-like protein [Hortaea werneckii]|nr:sn-1,2-diacylglycerol cholinephosphotransferase-like protein [Hortaea werneckii]KAI6884256.1 sn-1,2-diacylglycerol cholinephosphotransferase-like protein [Hortaea werneckii]KAI6987359.1 sn-1,2-diacylglycerol cholinephosphotransferase-like protein [Hortaea werneckii]KAI7141408.1 sn-1,2-diacylglycerol cholinephosphotransferase-like protein [Hortaea werneckii]KAI7168441.1 sn-1,2-diacylglycerol cholinephosphotransferase-like protein [Hortaea werneckii]